MSDNVIYILARSSLRNYQTQWRRDLKAGQLEASRVKFPWTHHGQGLSIGPIGQNSPLVRHLIQGSLDHKFPLNKSQISVLTIYAWGCLWMYLNSNNLLWWFTAESCSCSLGMVANWSYLQFIWKLHSAVDHIWSAEFSPKRTSELVNREIMFTDKVEVP